MLDLFAQHLSYAGIVIALILTGTGLPIPEEVLIIVAGAASSRGALDPWLAFGSCIIGALLGDLATYGIGRHFGKSVVREHPWFARFVTPERERQIEEMIKLHGLKVFFLARFLVGLRSPMYLTAGILRVPFRRFILVDTFCAASVIGCFFFLSYRFASQIEHWWNWIRHAEVALTVSIVAGVVGVILFFYVRHRRHVARLKVEQGQHNRLPALDEKHSANEKKSVA
jgi:membrane protein DedA with SNARE-associated domain